MNTIPYMIDFKSIRSIIQEHQYRRILLHLPDGLKYHIDEIIQEITHEMPIEIYISADSCYGACDIPCTENLKHMNIEAIFQIGHTPIPSICTDFFSLPVYFINALSPYPVEDSVNEAIPLLEGKNIGIVTTAQHLHTLTTVASILSSNGFIPLIAEGDHRISAPGQILGCNTSVLPTMEHTIDSILYIGSGLFHPIALLLSTQKPVIAADPITKTVQKETLHHLKEDILKKRYTAIALAKQAHTFGILISTKPGQMQQQKAHSCKQLLTTHQKKYFFFVLDTISPYLLEQFPMVDCYISTACPRIVIDDAARYKKPMITPIELKIAYDELPIESYQFEEITNQ